MFCSVFCDEIIDQLVDEYMFDVLSMHGNKHPFESDLHNCHLSCIESEVELDPESDLYANSNVKFDPGFDLLGVVPFEVDFVESECTNPFARNTYASNLLYEMQAEEPSSSPPTVQPSTTPELKPLPENLKYAYL